MKVLGKRRTVFGTAWYQLEYASYKVGVVRFHVATWFGCVSYRKFKYTVEKRKELCPICADELVRITYSGFEFFVKDGGSVDYQRDSFEDYEENGVPVWFEYVKRKWSGGSYEE